MSVNLMHQYILEEKVILQDVINNRNEILRDALSTIDRDIEHVYLIGSGTSYHASIAAKMLIEQATNWKVTCTFPTHFLQNKVTDKNKTMVIGISQSGKSLSTINGIKKAKDMGMKTIGMSEYRDSELGEISDSFIPIYVGEEEKVGAKTKGYVSSALTLMLLALEFGNQHVIDEGAYDDFLSRVNKSIANLDNIYGPSEAWVSEVKQEFKHCDEAMVIGYGANYATALEGGLKLLETIRVPVIGYEMEEYMHGIYNCINEKSFLIFLSASTEDTNRERMFLLKDFLSDETKNCYVIGNFGDNQNSEKDLHAVFTDDPLFSLFEYIIPLQLLGAVVANEKNINPDTSKFSDFHQRVKSKL